MLSLLVYESPILISLNKPFQSYYLVYTAISALIFLYIFHMLSKRAGTKNFILINQYDERAGLSMYINALLKTTIENITDQFILFVKIIISMRSVLLSWLNNSCDFLSPSMYADSAHDDYGHSDKKVEQVSKLRNVIHFKPVEDDGIAHSSSTFDKRSLKREWFCWVIQKLIELRDKKKTVQKTFSNAIIMNMQVLYNALKIQ